MQTRRSAGGAGHSSLSGRLQSQWGAPVERPLQEIEDGGYQDLEGEGGVVGGKGGPQVLHASLEDYLGEQCVGSQEDVREIVPMPGVTWRVPMPRLIWLMARRVRVDVRLWVWGNVGVRGMCLRVCVCACRCAGGVVRW